MIAAKDPIFRGHSTNVVTRSKPPAAGSMFTPRSEDLNGLNCAGGADSLSVYEKS